MSWAAFRREVRRGARWLVVDGTILDVSALTGGEGVHKGGGEVLSRAVGEDITGYFAYFHANLPRTMSLHKPGLSHLEHVREKVAANVVGVLTTHRHLPSLASPEHRFWEESSEKEQYHEVCRSSLAMAGSDAAACIAAAIGSLPPESPQSRAFWAVVGCLVADAAAQPSHWNYKVSYFHQELHNRGRFDTPEFVRPSMNTYYKVPMGSQSCYGDQAVEVLRSLVACRGMDPEDVEHRFAERFGEEGEYGPLPAEGLYNGNREGPRALPISGPWRHISLAGFLKNLHSGRHWPKCGTGDANADCFVRVVPVVALYAGHPDLLDMVREAVIVTQDNPPAVAVGQAFARILEAAILAGTGGAEAIGAAIAEFGSENCRGMEVGFYGRVADTMTASSQLRNLPFQEAVLSLSGGHYSTSKVA